MRHHIGASYRFYVLERMPNWKCYQICQRIVAYGHPLIDAAFENKIDAEEYYKIVSNARPDSEFKIIEVEVAVH